MWRTKSTSSAGLGSAIVHLRAGLAGTRASGGIFSVYQTSRPNELTSVVRKKEGRKNALDT